MQVAAAIGTGVGVLGFVIFVGGVIIWTRFDTVGVPAADAVAIVPREVLLTTGASVLAPVALVGLGLVALLFIVDSRAQHLERQERALLAATLADKHKTCAIIEAEVARADASVQAAAAAATNDQGQTLTTALNTAAALSAQADAHRSELRQVQQELASVIAEQAKRRSKGMKTRFFLGFAFLLIATLAVTFGTLGFQKINGSLVVFVSAVVTSLVALAIYARTRKFVAFGLAAFLASSLTFACGKYFDTRNDPLLVPAAALRTDRAPVAGFLVAQTSDRIYLGIVDDVEQTHVLALDRKKVTDFAVDDPVNRDRVQRDARALAVGLCQGYGRDSRTRNVETGKLDPPAWPAGKDQMCSALEAERL